MPRVFAEKAGMHAIVAHGNVRALVRAAVITAAYLCAFIALDLASQQFEELRGVVAWYPPAGLTYALLLAYGVSFAPAVAIALLVGSVFVYHMPQPLHLLLLWAVTASSVYGAAAAFLHHRVHLDWQLRKLRDVTWLVVTGVVASALLAVLSVSGSAFTSDMPRNEVLRAILIWWIGETVGVLTVGPFLLVHVMPLLKRLGEGRLAESPVRRPRPRPALSIIGQAVSIALVFYWAFAARSLDEFRPIYLITLPLVWIALDRGFRGVTVGIIVLNIGVVLAVWSLRLDPTHLGELQLLMIVNCIVGLVMGGVVTERKREVTEKEALQAQLQQSQKMDAIGQLAGGVAHDFNNLLTGILGNVAIMRSDLKGSDPLAANLNAVENAARQAANLAKGLLAFSRKAVVVAVPLDMTAAVDATLAMLKESLPATMSIVRDVEDRAWSVFADPAQITQVILNLAVNARDAMQGKGKLTIRLRNEVLGQEDIRGRPLARPGDFVHLSIADNGPGIPAEIWEHLFEPFHTTKPPGSGTGLGLSIVYGAVKQADGWVTADSAIGGGTVFDIFLPRCLEEPSGRGGPDDMPISVGSGTVLVVEDEPMVSDVTTALLSRSGYNVLAAPDGTAALGMFQKYGGKVDLILLDMTMPGMTTEEIVRAIRGADARVAILLTSGHASGETVARMLNEKTVQGFMAKPYDLREMLDHVEKLMRGA